MAEQTVSAGYAASLVKAAEAKGVEARALLAAAGLTRKDLSEQDRRLPYAAFKALMRAAQAMSGDPAFALYFGANASFADMSIVGLLAYAAETVGEAFHEMNRYARLVVEVEGHEAGPRFAVVRRADGTWIEDQRRNPNDFPELTESTWARFVGNYARAFPNRPPFVLQAQVTHARPAHAAAYRDYLNAPVVFGAPWNALQVTDDWLASRTGSANRYVFGLFSERAASLLKALESDESLRGRLERLILPILHTGDSGMARLAALMGMSRPTLYRQLKGEGATYEQVLDDLRARMAGHYLASKRLSVSQTAYLVGFSDTSAFSRAYRRWTGKRPGGRRTGA